MTKRRSEPGEPIPSGMRSAIEPATVSTETAPESVPQGYTEAGGAAEQSDFDLATWKGFPQWRCRRCAWDTLAGKEAILAHIQEVHEPPLRPASPPLVAVSDRWGRVVREPAPQERPPSEGGQEE